MDTRQVDYLEKAPQSAKNGVQKAFLGACSPRAAIKAKCLDCCHFDRDEVRDCTVTLCALHQFRPFQAKKDPPKRA